MVSPSFMVFSVESERSAQKLRESCPSQQRAGASVLDKEQSSRGGETKLLLSCSFFISTRFRRSRPDVERFSQAHSKRQLTQFKAFVNERAQLRLYARSWSLSQGELVIGED